MAEILRFCFGWIPFVGRLFHHEDRIIPVDLPPAKVAIIGGGIGGCSAAYFLRSIGGEALDIHLFTDGVIGGRCAVIEVDGQMYESGGAIIHSSNKYLVDFRKEFSKFSAIPNKVTPPVVEQFCKLSSGQQIELPNSGC